MTICAACGHENPDRARFCLECGTAFAIRCSTCNAELPAGTKFCLACGLRVRAGKSDPRSYTPRHLAEQILTSRAALEGERKQVTVLFADVKGSTELSLDVGAEEWHGILDRFFRILAEGVHRFEGTVNQYTGDGIMALFGAPLAHEDHAQRACYAALHLRDALKLYSDELRLSRGLDFAFRIGLNTGEVVVGRIGDQYHAEWMSKSYYRQLPLLPLGREATKDLLADLLGRDPSLLDLCERIHERTEGNPFFIEELAQSLIESGSLEGTRGACRLVAPVEQLELPGTVQAVLAARIDRLPERDKRLLQTASVIGREFPERILKRVADQPEAELSASLSALVQGEFLFEKALYPEAEYAFKHPLTQEVAYQSQLTERRARTHAAVASALEELDADLLDERAALLAHHWDEAGEALLAARWHARAARRSSVGDPPDAQRRWSQVWALRAEARESEETAALRLEAAIQLISLEYRMGADEHTAKALLSEGLALAARRRDVRSRVLLLIGFAEVYGTIGELSGGMPELEEAYTLGTRSDDPELRFTVHEGMIDRLQFTGRLSEAAALGDRYVAFGRALPPGGVVRGFYPVAWSLGRRAWVWIELGRLDAAEAGLREAAEGMRRITATEFLSYVEALLAKRAALAGDADAACLHARLAFDIAEKVGSTIARVWAEEYLGVALGSAGDWSAAVLHLEAALRIARETRVWLTIEAEVLAYLAEARLGAGEMEAAQRTAAEAIETARRRKTPVWEAQAQLALARVLLARSGAKARSEIGAALGSCLALIQQTEARVHLPHVHELRGELAGRLGDEAAALRELREAHHLFAAMGAGGHAERVARELAPGEVLP